MKNKDSNCHTNKCNIWSTAPKGARHQKEVTDWLSIAIKLELTFVSSISRLTYMRLSLRNCVAQGKRKGHKQVPDYADPYTFPRRTKYLSLCQIMEHLSTPVYKSRS
jgi:hypothetical protein